VGRPVNEGAVNLCENSKKHPSCEFCPTFLFRCEILVWVITSLFFRVWRTWAVIFAQEGGQFDVNYMEKSKKAHKRVRKKDNSENSEKVNIFSKKNIFDDFF